MTSLSKSDVFVTCVINISLHFGCVNPKCEKYFTFFGCCFLRPREERTQVSQKSPLLYCHSKRAPNTRLSARRPECTRRNAYLNQRFTAVYKRRSTALRIYILTAVIFPARTPHTTFRRNATLSVSLPPLTK